MNGADFAKRYGPWAVIAGGSEGVGLEFADRLAKQGLKLLLIARSPGPLEETAGVIHERYGTEVRTLAQDLTAPDAVSNVIAATTGCEVGLLVHNAGSDTAFDYFLDRPIEDAERLVSLNVFVPMRLVHHFARAMAARRSGGVILSSSLVSLAGLPGNGVYSSAKAFVNNFAEVLWYEIGQQGVDVLAVLMPPVKTPAVMRIGFKLDDSCSEPGDIVDEALANLQNGPILEAGGARPEAMLRSMPRSEAVRTLAAAGEKFRWPNRSACTRRSTKAGARPQPSLPVKNPPVEGGVC